jgi:two-component system response regulator MprA
VRIVVAEDDRAVREALDRALRLEGFEVGLAADGLEALGLHADRPADLLLVDVMMPVVDGLTLCKRVRADGDRTPILVLTARDAVSDRVAGLDAGADDYLAKPFALEELLARIRALLRRSTGGDGATLTCADLVLDPRSREARRGERRLELTKTEFDLLALLVRNQGVVLGRDTIYDRVWGYDFGGESKALDVYVGYLRRKTEEAGEPRLLHTVRGVGYVVRAQ